MSDLWPFPPRVPFTEVLSFLTDVQRAELAESRTSARHARSVYEMRHFLDDAANLEAEGVFSARRTSTFRVPAWGEATEFEVPVVTGATVLPIGPADWRDGGEVFLSGPAGQHEVRGIVALSGGEIELSAATTIPVQFAAPLRTCKAIAPLAGVRMFRGLSERQTTFVTQDNIDLAETDLPLIDGRPVIDDPYEVVQSPEQAMVHPVEMVDTGFGGIEVIPLRPGVDHRLAIAYSDVGAVAIWRRRRFWHALRGRSAEFWLPSFAADLKLAAAVGAANLTVTIAAPGWSPDLLQGTVLAFDDGAGRVYRKVTGVTPSGPVWEVAIAAAPGKAFAATAVVSIARRMRLDQDDIPLTFVMPGFMRSGAACVGVP